MVFAERKKGEMLKRAALFRYHDRFEVCIRNLKILRYLNPDLPVYGMFGGDEHRNPPCEELLSLLDHNYVLKSNDPSWKWKNGDLCICEWFRHYGREREFDVLHVVEWDLLYLEPLEKVLEHLEPNQVAISLFKPEQYYLDLPWDWITGDRAGEYEALKRFVRENAGEIPEDIHFGILGGLSLPYDFLTGMAGLEIPPYCNDEVRISLIARALGFPLVTTGLTENAKNLLIADDYGEGESMSLAAFERGANCIHPVRLNGTYDVIETVFPKA